MKYITAILPYETTGTLVEYSIFEANSDEAALFQVAANSLRYTEREMEEELVEYDGSVSNMLNKLQENNHNYCAFLICMDTGKVVFKAKSTKQFELDVLEY